MNSPSGLLCLNKPAGLTSRDLVNRIQRVLRPAKVGHAGTLDPMATGVLLVAVGSATRLISHLQQREKVYESVFELGCSSDTDDITGAVTRHAAPDRIPDESAITIALREFTGQILQHPPAFSAVHIQGRRAYELARQGNAVIPNARTVEVQEITVHRWEWPELSVRIRCGSGTYIRSIARDLGIRLGCGGLMSSLQRTAIGEFHLEQALDCEEPDLQQLATALIPPVQLVGTMPQYFCDDEALTELRCGRRIRLTADQAAEFSADSSVALISADRRHLLALAEVTAEEQLQPRTVFQQAVAEACGGC